MAGTVDCVSWYDSAERIRVYHSNGSQVTERCCDGRGKPWYTGAMKAVGTAVGATSWTDSKAYYIRVYVCGPDGAITEHCCVKGKDWYIGNFKANGVGASATCWNADDAFHLRVYVSDQAGNVTEHCYDVPGGKWYVGAYTEA